MRATQPIMPPPCGLKPGYARCPPKVACAPTSRTPHFANRISNEATFLMHVVWKSYRGRLETSDASMVAAIYSQFGHGTRSMGRGGEKDAAVLWGEKNGRCEPGREDVKTRRPWSSSFCGCALSPCCCVRLDLAFILIPRGEAGHPCGGNRRCEQSTALQVWQD